MSIQCDYR